MELTDCHGGGCEGIRSQASPEPADRTHPDFLAACEEAYVLPERCFFTARTDERTTARRAVACRLLAAGWKPGRVRRLLGLSRWQIARYARASPSGINAQAWRIEPGTPDSPFKRKVRRLRES